LESRILIWNHVAKSGEGISNSVDEAYLRDIIRVDSIAPKVVIVEGVPKEVSQLLVIWILLGLSAVRLKNPSLRSRSRNEMTEPAGR
jgi:hypothetical protein